MQGSRSAGPHPYTRYPAEEASSLDNGAHENRRIDRAEMLRSWSSQPRPNSGTNSVLTDPGTMKVG